MRGSRRAIILVLLLGSTLLAGGCEWRIGCRTYTLDERNPALGIQVDDAACEPAPPPVVPEAPMAVLLPLLAVAAGGAVLALRRRAATPNRTHPHPEL